MRRASVYGMGSQKKLSDRDYGIIKYHVAGPGDYSVQEKITVVKTAAPSYGFGSSSRPDYANRMSPGPGAYKAPTSIGNLPQHAVSNQKSKVL